MGSVSKQMRLAVIDDHPLLRQGVVKVLSSEADFRVVAEGGNAAEAIAIAREQSPDLMLLDLDIPGGGLNVLKELQRSAPGVRCVVLTVCDQAETAIAAMNSGARGYILKGVGARDLKAALRTVLADNSFISPDFAAKLLRVVQDKTALSMGATKLSVREEQVLELVEGGLTNRQIATRLDLSERTVKHYMSAVMQKYGVTNRVSALMQFRQSRGDGARL